MEIKCIEGTGFASNVYVIGERVVVDTGLDAAETIAKLERVCKLEKIEVIVLTHRHCDHTGGAKKLQEVTGAEVLAHPQAAEILSIGNESTTGCHSFGVSLPPLEVHPLSEGRMNIGEGEWEVIYTPGHTIDSISLYHRETKALICGDTLFAHGGVGRWDLATGDYHQLLQSVSLLSGMEIESIYPGHGPWVRGNAKKHIENSLAYLRIFGRGGVAGE